MGRSGSYSVVYHLIDLDELSFSDAAQVYVKFKSMMDEKRNLNEWPQKRLADSSQFPSSTAY